jgi:hypothetical protein
MWLLQFADISQPPVPKPVFNWVMQTLPGSMLA